ncbi:ABC transporter substrate-binding protein [Paenibacillus methanolicus]|uniref:Putative aldouronate transport system substrate-binding protein n=1 Tax=Paenibacillus methanolicus TaxID=582686 RepID=A0A5S5CCX9_9BACL|nr:ABC transporter substrate-binding protein [Paenibacillus methanolicus]TYP76498.1 putative aldouronate transport system substrate-binding protein [Paenibacillus methanolicus]
MNVVMNRALKLVLLTGVAALALAGCLNGHSLPIAKKEAVSPDAAAIPELSLVFSQMQRSADLLDVQEQMNRILVDKIGAKVKLVPIPSDDYSQQLNLMMLKKEPLDLFVSINAREFKNMIVNEHIRPLRDLVERYGPDIKQTIGDSMLDSLTIGSDLYAIPSIRDWASSHGFMIRKDVAEKYGISPASIRTIDDVEQMLAIIKAQESDLTPIASFNTQSIYTGLSSGAYDAMEDRLGILPDFDHNLKLVNLYETEQYAKDLRRIRRWYLKGYIGEDAAVSEDTGRELVRAGVAFAYFSSLKPGVEEQESRLTGRPMLAVQLTDATMTTSTIKLFGMSMAARTPHPKKAMELLNLLYADRDLLNLLNYGIEGKHYVKTSDQTITYPPGIDASNVGYSFNNYEAGNQFISYTWDSDSPELWERTVQFNQSARRSRALGFSFNPEPVKNELSAIEAVLRKYVSGLETGTLDPDATLPEFRDALRIAGIDRVIAEKQKQLDTWAGRTG